MCMTCGRKCYRAEEGPAAGLWLCEGCGEDPDACPCEEVTAEYYD